MLTVHVPGDGCACHPRSVVDPASHEEQLAEVEQRVSEGDLAAQSARGIVEATARLGVVDGNGTGGRC